MYSNYSLDVILAPLSLFFIAGFHAYIWHKSKHSVATASGLNMTRKRTWLQHLLPADDRKALLVVQSSRNMLMEAILSASISIIVNTTLVALINNTYKSSHLLHDSKVFGSQTGSLLVLKYASTSLLLLVSFLCSSIAVGCVIDANFLMALPGELCFADQAKLMLERGWVIATIGNRLLHVALWFLSWMIGPVLLFVSLVGTIYVFYCLDF